MPEGRKGAELKPGDTIEVWWQPKRDTIIGLQPYTGPLAYLFPEGAQLASFALNKGGMTIDNGEVYAVVTPERDVDGVPWCEPCGGYVPRTAECLFSACPRKLEL